MKVPFTFLQCFQQDIAALPQRRGGMEIKMNKFLTIGIAVYNIKEEYLRRCIESVISNRLSELEIIIVDDCSEESCSRVCREYRDSDDRIVYIRNIGNKGISDVRNTIIDRARGEWVFFADGDDMVAPCIGETLRGVSEYDLIIFNNKCFSDSESDSVGIWNDTTEPSIISLNSEEIYDMAIASIARRDVVKCEIDGFKINPGSVWATAYRTGFLKDGGFRFNKSLKTAEDSVFNASVLLKEPRAALCTEIIYYYRINPGSVTNRYDENLKSVTDTYLRVIAEFIKNNFNESNAVMNEFLEYRCTRAVVDNFERNIFHRDNPKPRKERKAEFYSLLESEPYKTAVSSADVRALKENKTRLSVRLAQMRMFGTLELFYRHEVLFKIYGGLSHRLNRLKKRFLT